MTNELVDAARSATTVATRSSLWANRLAITPGESVRLTGRVSYRAAHAPISPQGLRGQAVTLQRRTATGWALVTRGNLSRSGYLSVSVRPKVSARYRLMFAGASVSTAAGRFTLLGSNSAGVWIKVGASQARPTIGPVTLSASSGAPSARARQVVALAAAQTGKWYRWGYAGPTYFDCSGLTLYVFRSVGVYLPHNTDAQRHYGVAVSAAQRRPGDLIIFLTGGVGTHAAIYAGGGYMYDAPHTGTTVGLHRVYSTNVVYRRLV